MENNLYTKNSTKGFTRWMTGKDSLAALPHLPWNPALTDTARSLAEESRARLERLSGTAHAGLHLSADMVVDLKVSGFSPRECGERALGTSLADEDLMAYRMALNRETIPVRKGFADWLLFRSKAKVRERIFGPDGSRDIPPLEKQTRLKANSRAEFESQWGNAIRERFPAKPAAFASRLADAYAATTCEHILSGLRTLRASLTSQRDARQTPFNLQAAILRSADDLQHQAKRVNRDIELLSEKEDPSLANPPPIPSECTQARDAGLLPSPAMNMLPLLGP